MTGREIRKLCNRAKRGKVEEKVGVGESSLGEASAKKVIFYRTSPVLFGFTPIFYRRAPRIELSALLSVHRRQTFSYEMFLHILLLASSSS